MSRVGFASDRSTKNLRQQPSHAELSQDVSGGLPSLKSSRGRLDAIIVPASRRASSLQPVIELAAYLDVFLVVLCSKRTNAKQLADRVVKTPNARSIIIPIPESWQHSRFPIRTSDEVFQEASANRVSDLGTKRNLGLLLGRLNGWNKIVFVDDDVTLRRADILGRIAGQLDRHQVAGISVLQYPDNSVVCHARRLAGLAQGVFLTGAVLGVHCNSLPLSFFPDMYNEDWFFFAREAAARQLPHVGHAKQADYEPFASPDRARSEEFGDLLAEGLYALIGQEDPTIPFEQQLRGATRSYWERFIEARHEVITEAKTILSLMDRDANNSPVSAALASLAAAETQLGSITADLCVTFLAAWQDDLNDWQRFSNTVNNVSNTGEVMDFLQLETWTFAEFGAVVDSKKSQNRRM
jgi:hypothetical protein